MKKIALGALAVFIVLLAVLFIRMSLFTSKQINAEPAPAVKLDIKKALQNFSRAIQFKTISFQDQSKVDRNEFLGLHRFIQEAFPGVHAKLKKETVNDLTLLYTWKGSDESLKPALLMSHLDVVPVEPGTESSWTQPPFSGKNADGFIWGRGTQDIKVGVMGILEAVEYLVGKGFKPKRTVYLAFSHDEEVGGANGNKKIAELLASRGIKLEFVLDEGGTITQDIVKGIDKKVALLGIAEKGYLTLELTVTAEGGHSSMPPRETAVGILSKAIAKIQDNPFPEKIDGPVKLMFETLGPEMPFGNRIALSNLWLLGGMVKSQLSKSASMAASLHTTIAPTMLQGSVKENVLPSKAVGVINFRIITGDTVESVTEYVKKTIDDPRVQIKAFQTDNPSRISDVESGSYKNIQKTIRQLFPDTIVSPYLVLGATDSRHYANVTESIFRFGPTITKPDDLPRIHGTNERMSTENYEQCIRFYIQLIQNADAK
ncbi:MAG: M20 family peptidase [Spirochaetes bacterium]|nr:MAG: M20 family peptidase [Spirochaetota bacterium]